MLPVRSQGRRPSCLAFASTAAHEHFAKRGQYLSVEFLYYQAVERCPGKNPDAGTTMLATSEALAHIGQPDESFWPYSHSQVSPWSPPTQTTHLLKVRMSQTSAKFESIVQELDQGTPAILGLIITDSFFKPDSSGTVGIKTPDIERGGHAVLALGHGQDVDGNQYVLVRNSWGASWALGGYGWLASSYINLHLHEMAILTQGGLVGTHTA